MVLGIRFSLRLREFEIRGIKRTVPNVESPLCPDCGHPLSQHNSNRWGCRAAYTEQVTLKVRAVIMCGCKRLKAGEARKLAA